MQWFRSRSRLSSWLALFALAFQLVLAFGHVHAVPSLEPAFAGAQPTTVAPGNPAEPPGVGDDDCALCAILHLAGSLLPSQPPSLLLPALLHRPQLEAAVDLNPAGLKRAAFEARAPPIV